MREIRLIVVHCSASEWGDAEVIREWHTSERGWKDIGYHHVITNGRLASRLVYNTTHDGIVQAGRDVAQPGAHASGLNSYSIGICLIGNYHFTWNQFSALHDLLWKLREKYPDARIIGHRDVDKYGGKSGGKTCPNFNVGNFLNTMKQF
jgi:hypothetical protein